MGHFTTKAGQLQDDRVHNQATMETVDQDLPKLTSRPPSSIPPNNQQESSIQHSGILYVSPASSESSVGTPSPVSSPQRPSRDHFDNMCEACRCFHHSNRRRSNSRFVTFAAQVETFTLFPADGAEEDSTKLDSNGRSLKLAANSHKTTSDDCTTSREDVLEGKLAPSITLHQGGNSSATSMHKQQQPIGSHATATGGTVPTTTTINDAESKIDVPYKEKVRKMLRRGRDGNQKTRSNGKNAPVALWWTQQEIARHIQNKRMLVMHLDKIDGSDPKHKMALSLGIRSTKLEKERGERIQKVRQGVVQEVKCQQAQRGRKEPTFRDLHRELQEPEVVLSKQDDQDDDPQEGARIQDTICDGEPLNEASPPYSPASSQPDESDHVCDHPVTKTMSSTCACASCGCAVGNSPGGTPQPRQAPSTWRCTYDWDAIAKASLEYSYRLPLTLPTMDTTPPSSQELLQMPIYNKRKRQEDDTSDSSEDQDRRDSYYVAGYSRDARFVAMNECSLPISPIKRSKRRAPSPSLTQPPAQSESLMAAQVAPPVQMLQQTAPLPLSTFALSGQTQVHAIDSCAGVQDSSTKLHSNTK